MQVQTAFDLFLGKIRPNILDYLESKGYDTRSAIRCLNPDHNDRNPSLLVSNAEENDWHVWCASCGWRGDIFDVYSILEETADSGPNWMRETVLPLSTKYGVPPPQIDLSPEEQFRHDLYKAFDTTANLLNHNPNKMAEFPKKYVEEHEWTTDDLISLDIGTLDFKRLEKYLSEDDRKKYGLNRPDVFSEDNLLFVVRDLYGRPIRVFARQPDGKDPKFTSTAAKSLMYNIWKGKGHLYLSDKIERGNPSAVIVEGHSDAVTLYLHGINNTFALCGCKMFSEEHADILAMNGISQITLVFDGDKRGEEALEKLLEKDFIKRGGLNYEVLVMPDGTDPDKFVREEGIEKFNTLLKEVSMTSFQFLLSRVAPGNNPEDTCEFLVPYIASSRSEVTKERMARELAEYLDGEVSVSAIMADVRKLDDAVISERLEKQKVIVNAVTRQVTRNLPQCKEILRDAVDKLEQLDRQGDFKDSKTTCLSRIQALKTIEENHNSGGYELPKNKLGNLSAMLSGGDWADGRIIIVAGVKNVGKSTFIDNFLWQAASNQDNNAISYLLTIDDPLKARIRRLGCVAVGSKDFTQNMIGNPRKYADELGIPGVREQRDYAYSKITEMVASGRLIIEDQRNGNTLAYAERRISQIRRENPDSKIIFGLDNFHDTSDWDDSGVKDPVGKKIKYAKRICELEGCLGIFAAEYRKLQFPGKPGTDNDIADSRAMEYAPHLTLHLFSDWDEKSDDAKLVHIHNGQVLPRVLVNVGKNKITEIKGKGRLFYNFYPAAAQFYAVDPEIAKKEYKIRKEALAKKYEEDDNE